MKRVVVTALTLSLVLVLAGCSAFINGFKEGLEQQTGSSTDGVQVVSSDVSSLSMEFPDSWRTYELNENSSIQMAHLVREQYFAVIEESGIDFDDNFTIENYASAILSSMLIVVDTTEKPQIMDAIINGIDVKQFELSGSFEGIRVTYLITFANTNGMFYQFIAWTLQSRYETAKPVFEGILESMSFQAL